MKDEKAREALLEIADRLWDISGSCTGPGAQRIRDGMVAVRELLAEEGPAPPTDAEGECEHFAQWGDEGATGCAALSPEDDPHHIACVISKWRHSKGPLAQRQDCPIRSLAKRVEDAEKRLAEFEEWAPTETSSKDKCGVALALEWQAGDTRSEPNTEHPVPVPRWWLRDRALEVRKLYAKRLELGESVSNALEAAAIAVDAAKQWKAHAEEAREALERERKSRKSSCASLMLAQAKLQRLERDRPLVRLT